MVACLDGWLLVVCLEHWAADDYVLIAAQRGKQGKTVLYLPWSVGIEEATDKQRERERESERDREREREREWGRV